MSDASPQGPRLATTGLRVVRRTPLLVHTFAYQLEPPQPVRIVLVKGTFDLISGERAVFAGEQRLFSGDLRRDDDPAASLRYASDFVPFKPKVDVLFSGYAYLRPAEGVARVELSVGTLVRRLAVFGDRTWKSDGTPGSPRPVDRVALVYERAAGGPGQPRNPLGVDGKTSPQLPNLELVDRLVRTQADTPPPAGVGPIAAEWPVRSKLLGTYNEPWLASRWPYLPKDFDFRFFQAAPEEQQLAVLQGNEPYGFSNVRPNGQRLEGELPSVGPRAFVRKTEAEGGSIVEVILRLDTAFFDLERAQVQLLWRGHVATRDDDASDLRDLLLVGEPESRAMSLEDVPRQLDKEKPAVSARAGGAPAPPKVRRSKVVPRAEIEAWLRDGVDLAGKDLSGAELRDLDFSGKNMSRAILLGADLSGARFERARCSGVLAAGARAKDARFVGAELERADFHGADLTGADFSGAHADRATFAEARCEGAKWDGARLCGADFSGAILAGGSFRETVLTKANLARAELSRADLRSARLGDAKLYEARGTQVLADEAEMEDARFDGAVLSEASFRRARAKGSSWENAELTRAVFFGASLCEATFGGARLAGCIYSEADARRARFKRAVLSGSSFLKANLMEANFEGADFGDSDLRGANLFQAETWRAKTEGARWELAILDGTKLASR